MVKLDKIAASSGVESALGSGRRGPSNPRLLNSGGMQDGDRRTTLAVAVPAEEPQAARMSPSAAINTTRPLMQANRSQARSQQSSWSLTYNAPRSGPRGPTSYRACTPRIETTPSGSRSEPRCERARCPWTTGCWRLRVGGKRLIIATLRLPTGRQVSHLARQSAHSATRYHAAFTIGLARKFAHVSGGPVGDHERGLLVRERRQRADVVPIAQRRSDGEQVPCVPARDLAVPCLVVVVRRDDPFVSQ